MADNETLPHTPLTDRELQVLNCIAQGYLAKETARVLKISYRTIEYYSSSILHKMRARRMPHAVALAVQYGLVERVEPLPPKSATTPKQEQQSGRSHQQPSLPSAPGDCSSEQL